LAGLSRIVNVKKFEINLEGKKRKRGRKGKGVAAGDGLNIECTAETYKFVESSPATEENADGKGKKKNKKKKKK